MTVTIRDVARAAEVSQATAARALGGYGYVSDAARRSVEEAAARLHYVPNSVARALASGTTGAVGLVVGDIENPFFAAAARGMGDVMEEHGVTVLLANSDEELARERTAVAALRARRVDGLVVVPSAGTASEHLTALVEARTPLVLLDRPVRGLGVDSVLVDNTAGARAAVDHLVGFGHRRIAVVSDTPDIGSSAERLTGFQEGLAAVGITPDPSLIALGGPAREDGYRLARALLTRAEPPTALFTANNFMTVGAMRVVRELGLRVPEELSIVGFDDLEWTTIVAPPLTVVAQPAAELGAEAARRLLLRIEGGGGRPRRVRLRTTLISRGSCAPPRR